MDTALSLIVIPLLLSSSRSSKSCSFKSLTATAPVFSKILSAKVDLPWSICATIEKFLICFKS